MHALHEPSAGVTAKSASSASLRRPSRLGGIALALALTLAACGGDDDGAPDGGSVTGDSGTGGGGCTPSGATVLADFASFDESPAYSMHLFGERLFVQYIDQVVELPTTGGAPVERYRTTNPVNTGIGTYRRNNDTELVLVPSGGQPMSVLPVAGGAARELTIDRTTELVLGYDPGTDALVIQPAATSDTHDLALAPLDGSPRRVVAAGETGSSFVARWYVYGGYAIRRFEGSTSSLELVALADGSRSTLAVNPSASSVYYVSPTHLYYSHGDSLAQAGLWRQPLGGGAAERVVEGVVFAAQFAAGGGRYGIHLADRIFVFGDGAPGVPATRFDVPVAGTGCTSHALALSADAFYSTMYRSLAETSMVFRVAR